jgi:hypothetical protein
MGSAFLFDEMVGVLRVIVRAIFPSSYLNHKDRGVSTAGGGMANTARFKESNKIRLV